jgi:hypothetical protein
MIQGQGLNPPRQQTKSDESTARQGRKRKTEEAKGKREKRKDGRTKTEERGRVCRTEGRPMGRGEDILVLVRGRYPCNPKYSKVQYHSTRRANWDWRGENWPHRRWRFYHKQSRGGLHLQAAWLVLLSVQYLYLRNATRIPTPEQRLAGPSPELSSPIPATSSLL